MKDENKENTIILNNKSYSNNNDVLSEIITKLEKVVTDLGKTKKDSNIVNKIKEAIEMTNKVINDNKSNFEEIRKDLQALNGVQIKDYEEGKYQGEFRNGKRDGRGIFIYKTGDRYEGEFRNDKAEGRGRFLWKAGNKYEGYFVNGLRTGRGYSSSRVVTDMSETS